MSQPASIVRTDLDTTATDRPAVLHAAPTVLDCDDTTLARHLPAADLPALLMTAAWLSGDASVLRDEWRPVVDISGVAMCKLAPEVEQAARATCLEKLRAFRDRGTPAPARPDYDTLRRFGDWLMGPAIEPYLPLVHEELVETAADPREPGWTKARVAPGRPFHVAIVGAGESGLALGFRLKQAGVPFTIYEKNDEVGGTWLENDYPGCRVDINSFYYSYAFARRTWTDFYGKREDVLAYLRDVAREAGLYEHIRFNTEVTAASWDEAANRWTVETASGGRTETLHAEMLVSAVGQLNRPMMPDIPGIDSFEGDAFHSARWDHDVSLEGKRVAVIGTGASAVQFIREIAKRDCDVSIFARTTNWLLPTPDLLEPVGDSVTWLLENVPHYALFYRAALVMVQSIGFLDDITVDPDYPPTERAVSARNDALREAFTAWMEPQIADRPDLRDVVIPDSPVGAKRIVRDDGSWIETLKRDNVRVIKDRIEAITPNGIRTADGTEHDFDVIIYGTGFRASEFLMPMQVTGRDDVDLHETWGDDARAYLGTAIPGFPNLFCMYGPNTNLVVYGSIIMFSEQTAQYITDAARTLLEGGHEALEVREDVFESYNARVDERNRNIAFGFSSVNSWYKNSRGRVTQNFPFHAWEFWRRTRAVESADYRFF